MMRLTVTSRASGLKSAPASEHDGENEGGGQDLRIALVRRHDWASTEDSKMPADKDFSDVRAFAAARTSCETQG
jgi:hypothetical protein